MQQPHHYTYVERDEIERPGGRNDAWWVTHTSYGKESLFTEDSPSPYLFPNEWIAGCIAQFLRIPVPPFCVMRLSSRVPPMFTNLQFTPGRMAPPDTKPEKCWERHQWLCTGIALFDILIGNEDRASRHIAVDDPDNPTELIPYDHDCAVAGDLFNEARTHFRNRRDDFLATDHCLVPLIDTAEHFNEWIARVEAIPRWFLDDICMEARTKGFGAPEARAAASFLWDRAHNFRNLVRRHKHRFTGISTWTVLI